MKQQLVHIKILDKRAVMPQKATKGSAGVDLVAIMDKAKVIRPFQSIMVTTGMAVHMQSHEIAGFIFPRSGLGSKHGIVLGNGTGVIDSDYQGELQVCLYNRTSIVYTVYPGDRVAQLVFMPVYGVSFKLVTDFETKTERGEGGFGHTGV